MDHKIFAYRSLGEFFADFIAHKRHKPSWSMGVWARDLKLKNMATLTRVVNGERSIGPELEEKFIEYFRFDPNEADYFRHLVLAEKNPAGSPLRAFAERRLQELLKARGEKNSDALFTFHSERMIALWGTVDVAKANAILDADNLEAVSNSPRALSGFMVADYDQTTFGPANSSFFAVIARRRGSQLDRAGFYYRFLFTDNSEAITFGAMTWGNIHRRAVIDVSDGKKFPVAARIALPSGPVLSLGLDESLAMPPAEEAAPHLWAISNQPHYQSRFLSTLEMLGHKRQFDAARDTFVLGDSPLAEFCAAADFQPYSWATYTRVSGQTFGPTEL